MLDLVATNSLARLAVLVVVFVAAIGGVYALGSWLGHRSALRAQLRQIGEDQGVTMRPTSLRSHVNEGAWAKLAAAIEAAGLDLTDTKSERLTAKLRAAGYTSTMAPRVFTLSRLIGVFALPLGYIALAYSGPGDPPSFLKVYLIGASLALLGLYLPNLFVQAKADRRRDELLRGFPDCLDLLIICIESGLSIEAAMDRVGREMVLSHPLVAEMLSVATLQLRAGASREDAFRKMSDMAGVDEIRSFTTLIIQSDKLGTSIATTLRVYASEMRERRKLRAEERAHRLPVLISIPLVMCMLPVMIGVLMLPAVVRLVKTIFPMMMGG
ncbi:type II secretion system F family protein [Novosphingobium sp.]|uniref:type II secretion system F family protein n=1 Tax=Novosphingobium sp. TaxID=1874826 RepID=UPI0035B24DBA